MELEINKTLTISTAHITEFDDTILRDDGPVEPSSISSFEFEYGHFIIISQDPEIIKDLPKGMEEDGFSDALINLVKLAAKNECSYLQLDCDGPEHDELKRFDWDDGE